MAKYDHGGGCPCGLYSECNDGCHGYPKGMSVATTDEEGLPLRRVVRNGFTQEAVNIGRGIKLKVNAAVVNG